MMKAKYLAGILLLVLGFAATSCSEDDDYSVATGNIISVVETGGAAVTATSAVVQGIVLDLSGYASSSYSVGVVYSTNQDPTTSGKRQSGSLDEAGTVTTTLTNLAKGVTYYYATFVTLQGKVTKYGEVKSFITSDAQVALVDVSSATLQPTSITVAAQLTQAGADEVGFKIAKSEDDILSGVDYPVSGSVASGDTFQQVIEGLLPGQDYYVAAYFKLNDGYVFSAVQKYSTIAQEIEYVDLGLSVMWAKYNLGAQKETEMGALIGYGDVTGLNVSEYLTQYASQDIAGTDEDVAFSLSAVIDGESTMKSQMPTNEMVAELFEKTTQEVTTIDDVQGVKFTARNGNYIFLPFNGYRQETTVVGEGSQGTYWMGTLSIVNVDYANTISLTSGGASIGASKRSIGLGVRSVRAYEPTSGIEVDVNKLAVGDLESNGRIRIEIYNEYGNTASNPGLNMSQLHFEKNMLVRFRLSGITDNLVENAPGEFVAGLEYAANDWDPSLWSDFNQKYDTRVNGDGEYTVWMETAAPAEGAVVFCVDIADLGANLVDPSLVKVESLQIILDADDSAYQYFVDNSKVVFENKDGDGVNGRIEIYNEWGDTKGLGADYSDLSFNGTMIVEFTISGIDENLVNGASKSYNTELSFANQSWTVQYWGNNAAAAATVTGDGTYTVWAPLAGDVTDGPVVWTIELYDLWKDLVDTSKIKATIDKVIIPGKK